MVARRQGKKGWRRERGDGRTNVTRMACTTFVAQGLPIGSGAGEAAAQHQVQLRMRRLVARGSPAGGQAILALGSSLASRPTRSIRSSEHRRPAEAAERRRHAEAAASRVA